MARRTLAAVEGGRPTSRVWLGGERVCRGLLGWSTAVCPTAGTLLSFIPDHIARPGSRLAKSRLPTFHTVGPMDQV